MQAAAVQRGCELVQAEFCGVQEALNAQQIPLKSCMNKWRHFCLNKKFTLDTTLHIKRVEASSSYLSSREDRGRNL